MRINIIIFCFFILLQFSTFGQSNSKADSIIREKLDLIQRVIDKPNSDPSLRRAGAIAFLENLTGIASESDGSYAGKTSASKRDFYLWNSWYQFNRKNIFWDEVQQAVVITKSVKPREYQ